MIIKTSGQKLCCNDGKPHIFLAGPTPRGDVGESWRPQALAFLNAMGYEGIVSAPEPFCDNYVDQVEWEAKHLEMATCIVFWVPRCLETMPAFTTNIEWGEWYKSGKAVLGFPYGSPKMRYLKYKAEKHDVLVAHTLEETIKNAIRRSR